MRADRTRNTVGVLVALAFSALPITVLGQDAESQACTSVGNSIDAIFALLEYPADAPEFKENAAATIAAANDAARQMSSVGWSTDPPGLLEEIARLVQQLADEGGPVDSDPAFMIYDLGNAMQSKFQERCLAGGGQE